MILIIGRSRGGSARGECASNDDDERASRIDADVLDALLVARSLRHNCKRTFVVQCAETEELALQHLEAWAPRLPNLIILDIKRRDPDDSAGAFGPTQSVTSEADVFALLYSLVGPTCDLPVLSPRGT